jgi:DNA polymerase
MHQPALSLGTLRTEVVFAVGDPMARLMFIGEAPGTEEELKGEPFVGPAGVTLTKMITAMGLQRSQVYISNICKFRPKIPGQTTENRKPDPQEMAACFTFIQQEIDIVQPDVIVALGATTAEGLLAGMTSVAVGRVRSRFHDYQGTPVMITYHPSYLLHNPAMSERRKVWEDLLKVMEKLELPINERQRGFFLPKTSQ